MIFPTIKLYENEEIPEIYGVLSVILKYHSANTELIQCNFSENFTAQKMSFPKVFFSK